MEISAVWQVLAHEVGILDERIAARETARHLRMPESTLNVWLAKPSTAPLVHSVTPEKRGWPRVPFVGIIEAYVLRSLRQLGVSTTY